MASCPDQNGSSRMEDCELIEMLAEVRSRYERGRMPGEFETRLEELLAAKVEQSPATRSKINQHIENIEKSSGKGVASRARHTQALHNCGCGCEVSHSDDSINPRCNCYTAVLHKRSVRGLSLRGATLA